MAEYQPARGFSPEGEVGELSMNNGSIALASAKLSHRFTDADHEAARRTILDAMHATKTVRSRNAEGRIIYIEVPAWEFRLPAAIKVAEFCGGKPVATSIVANLTPGGRHDDVDTSAWVKETLADDAAYAAYLDILAKQREALKLMKPKPAIDVSVTALPAPSSTEKSGQSQ